VKNRQRSALVVIDQVIRRLHDEHPGLALAVQKWRGLIFRLTVDTAKSTFLPEEEVLGELLLSVADVMELYRSPLFRRNRRLYHMLRKDGRAVLLSTPRTTKVPEEIWVDESSVEVVKTAKIESLLYNRLLGKAFNLVKSTRTEKRGYDAGEGGFAHHVDVDFPEYAGDSRAEGGLSSFEHPTGDEVLEHLTDGGPEPEVRIEAARLVRNISERISLTAQGVLESLCDDPGATDVALSRRLGMSYRRIEVARREISRTVSVVHKLYPEKKGCEPIYIKADQVC